MPGRGNKRKGNSVGGYRRSRVHMGQTGCVYVRPGPLWSTQNNNSLLSKEGFNVSKEMKLGREKLKNAKNDVERRGVAEEIAILIKKNIIIPFTRLRSLLAADVPCAGRGVSGPVWPIWTKTRNCPWNSVVPSGKRVQSRLRCTPLPKRHLMPDASSPTMSRYQGTMIRSPFRPLA